MDDTVESVYRQAAALSHRATALFAERDALHDQATQARRDLDNQRVQLQTTIDYLKAEADAYANEFKQCFAAASAAYASGDGAAAKGYSLQGHAAQSRCEALNAEWMDLAETLKNQQNAVDALYSAANSKHREAHACMQEAKQLRAQARDRQPDLTDFAQRGAMLLADSRCHVIQRHVGKTTAELKHRFLEEPHLAAASSFTTLILAAETVARASDRNEERIRKWLSTPSTPRLVIEYEGKREIGYVIQRTDQVLYPATRAIIILKRDTADPIGYYVVTAYPVV